VNNVGIWLLTIGVLCFVAMLFSTGAIALRMFSRVKLQEAFKSCGKESLADELVWDAERLGISCAFYRLAANLAIAAALLAWFAYANDWRITLWEAVPAFVISLVLVSIFSIAIPQSFAKYAGEKFLANTFTLLRFFVALAIPVLFIVWLYDALIRRLAGISEPGGQAAQEEREEEFLNVVEQGKMEGVVDEEEQQMIKSVLGLSETTVEKIMTPRTDVVSAGADFDLQGVLDAIATGHSRIPVYDGTIDNIIGFIYAKDMLTEVGKSPAEFKLRDKLRSPYFVPETKPLRILLHEFQDQKLHIAVVLDEYGGTAGIVTIEDILEELVGEIADEYEELPQSNIIHLDDTAIEVDARIHIDELNTEFGVELPEDEDYDTIGGFVFSHLGSIPRSGQSFEANNLKFTITSAEARKINRIRIQKISDTSGQSNA
jgi:CBS domain containing-hemolysin-like protein